MKHGVNFFVFFFFFSSRRRHTRCSRDWSSDVLFRSLAARARGAPAPKSDAVARGVGAPHHPRPAAHGHDGGGDLRGRDRKSTRLNSSHGYISYAVFCLKKKKKKKR